MCKSELNWRNYQAKKLVFVYAFNFICVFLFIFKRWFLYMYSYIICVKWSCMCMYKLRRIFFSNKDFVYDNRIYLWNFNYLWYHFHLLYITGARLLILHNCIPIRILLLSWFVFKMTLFLFNFFSLCYIRISDIWWASQDLF